MSTTTTLLRAKADLADAIVKAARQQRDDAGARPHSPANAGLYEGCCAALEQRKTEAAAARARLIRALQDERGQA